MYKFYKKCEKTDNNKYGLEKFEGGNPFEKPTFLALLALNTKLRDTNGSISRLLELSGVRTPDGEDNIPLYGVPVNFLGMSYSEPSQDGTFKKVASGDNFVNISDDTIDFVKTYIMPLILENGQKKDITECCKNMRNINIMCFCDALFMIGGINKILMEEMQKIGYTDDEIDAIMSQVCIIPIGTEYTSIKRFIKELKFTTVFLLDITDTFGITDPEIKSSIMGNNKEVCYNSSFAMDLHENEVCKNSKMLIADGGGEHSLKSFIHKGNAFPAIIIKLVNAILNNSVMNNSSDSYVPLNEIIEKYIDKLFDYYSTQDGLSKEEIIDTALQSIRYPVDGIIDLDYSEQELKQK